MGTINVNEALDRSAVELARVRGRESGRTWPYAHVPGGPWAPEGDRQLEAEREAWLEGFRQGRPE